MSLSTSGTGYDKATEGLYRDYVWRTMDGGMHGITYCSSLARVLNLESFTIMEEYAWFNLPLIRITLSSDFIRTVFVSENF